MAAVLAQGNRIIAIGINRENKTHPKQNERIRSDGKPCGGHRVHAELDALIRASYELIAGSTIYVARRKKNADIGLAAPCEACMNLLGEYEIRRAFFTVDHTLFQSGEWYRSINI